MQSAEKSDEHKSSMAGPSTENDLYMQKKRRSRDITELKAEAEGLKESLSSLTTEGEKSKAKERAVYFDDLFQFLETTNVKMDRKVLEHIMELLKLDVHPDNIVELLTTVMAMKNEEVIFIWGRTLSKTVNFVFAGITNVSRMFILNLINEE